MVCLCMGIAVLWGRVVIGEATLFDAVVGIGNWKRPNGALRIMEPRADVV